MVDKLESLAAKYRELEREMSTPEIFQDQERYRKIAKKHAELDEIVKAFELYKTLLREMAENQEFAKDPDPELCEIAQAEIVVLKARIAEQERLLKQLLTPKDPLDEKNIILEIRAGTGGEEAALFVADMFRMYSRYAELHSWRVEVLSSSDTGTGGFKEIIASVSGTNVYSKLKFESGAHRVQRVPATESQGRIHTSAITVAILPEAEEVDVKIDPNDIRVDVFRSSGPGGQSVNTTDSAIRITHLATGLVVICQDEKSQHKNKAKALKVLRSRLLQAAQDETKKAYDDNRKSHHLQLFENSIGADFDLSGASVGNLILTAGYLENRRHIDPIVYIYSKLVQVRGEVRILINSNLQLRAVLEGGGHLIGQHLLTGKETAPLNRAVTELSLVDPAKGNAPVRPLIRDKIREAIRNADLVCYPVGSFYSSLVANLLPSGVGQAISQAPCPKVFIPNTFADPESVGLSLAGQVRTLLRHLRADAPDSIAISDVLGFVLLDPAITYPETKNPERELASLGIQIIKTPLTVRNTGAIDPHLLCQALISLA